MTMAAGSGAALALLLFAFGLLLDGSAGVRFRRSVLGLAEMITCSTGKHGLKCFLAISLRDSLLDSLLDLQ